MSKATVVIAAFVAAIFFFVLAVFSVDLGDFTQLEQVAAGLLSMAAGFLIERLP